jgi:solute carrier family 25 oxoglutarate transporter 11
LEFSARIAASLVAGGTAALVGTPADAALVRIQSDTTLPVQSRRGYRNVFDALLRMLREEGLKGMFSGASPAMLRGLTLNMGMLATYDPTKDALTPILGKGIGANLGAATVSGTCAAIFSLPFDFIKTRLQKQIRGLDGQFTYSGIIDCFAKVSRREGLLALYNGFFTYCLRIAPNIMITWMTLEYLNSIESLK